MLDLSKARAGGLAHVAHKPRPIPAAMLTVLPDAAKLLFRGRSSALDAAGEAFGVALPREACRFMVKGERTAFWLGPDEWLLQATSESPGSLFSAMRAALAGQSHSLVDVSHASDAFAVSGERSAYVLNHGCPLDLSLEAFPVGMCTRTILGKAGIMLSRRAPATFHVDVGRSLAPYVWQWLDQARSEL
jgi:sarcosine oxidase subunit gamma